jgi:hypothetical protein
MLDISYFQSKDYFQSSRIDKYPAKLIHGIIQIYKVQASLTLG